MGTFGCDDFVVRWQVASRLQSGRYSFICITSADIIQLSGAKLTATLVDSFLHVIQLVDGNQRTEDDEEYSDDDEKKPFKGGNKTIIC